MHFSERNDWEVSASQVVYLFIVIVLTYRGRTQILHYNKQTCHRNSPTPLNSTEVNTDGPTTKYTNMTRNKNEQKLYNQEQSVRVNRVSVANTLNKEK
jgi:hypothetical protein